jgi:uncharacterized protein (DUF2147 family)
MRSAVIGCILLAACLESTFARADEGAGTLVGRWKTIDDKSGRAKSVVVIYEEDGKLSGKVGQLLEPNKNDPDPKCTKCSGDLKDKPILGLRIMWGLKKDSQMWSGGRIVDPDNGKVYRVNLTLTDGGKKLMVRGFIGLALLGRTQTWLREE